MVSDVDESEPESVVEAIDNEDDEDDDDASEPQPDNSKSRPKIKLLFKPKKGTKGQLNTGRYKSRTGSTRTASPGRINSDQLGPTRID